MPRPDAYEQTISKVQEPADYFSPVPFLDLSRVHEPLKRSLLDDISDLIDSSAFSNGPHVERFERDYAAYCRASHCVGVANGLDALRLSLIATGIEPGDEVIVPAQTFAATFEAISQAGGVPVIVDVGPSDYNLDVDAVAAAVTPRTRFLLPVHLYGQMADMRALSRLASRTGLQIVEDACQAHGAERDGLRAGAVGRAGAFSFYPSKNLGAMGDAGAVVTHDEELARRLRVLREHGQSRKHRYETEGYTSRLDTIQALVLLRKLPLLDGWNAERAETAAFYTEALNLVGDLRLPPVPAGSNPVWYVYVVATTDPAALATFLGRRGIASGRHYPEPPHLSPAYASLGHARGAFPVAEDLSDSLLSLPLFPGISEEQLTRVVDAVRAYFDGG